MRILGIETSCDETACAIVEDGTTILSNVIASSKVMHEKWGGIVPEVAAREQLESMIPVMSETLQSYMSHTAKTRSLPKRADIPAPHRIIQKYIDAIAVTVGPGLIGSLLIGVETAKTIAYATNKPIIPVNHVLAHIYANVVTKHEISSPIHTIRFPAIALVVSGGHTELYVMSSIQTLQWLGGTIDDAAGECFDKSARLIGLGHGGGMSIEQSARLYNQSTSSVHIKLPRPMMHDKTLNFSFSGLKTAIVKEWNNMKKDRLSSADTSACIPAFAYEIQEAITDVLVYKTLAAVKRYNAQSILISGGVAANTCLRNKFKTHISKLSIADGNTYIPNLLIPPQELCTDNAAAIASYAYFYNKPVSWKSIDAIPNLSVENIHEVL